MAKHHLTLSKFFLSLVLLLFAFSSALAEIVYIEPYTVNAAKGDIILTGDPGGFIGATLSSGFGGYWSHSGMMIDNGYSIRHNTMVVEQMRLNKNWLGVPTSINSYDLEHGKPGLITERTQWCGSTAVVLKPTDDKEAAYRPLLNAVADKNIGLAEWYRIHAYINSSEADMIAQYNNGSTLRDHTGTHCSGQLWYANYLAGKKMNIYHASTACVDAGAYALYDGLYRLIYDQVKSGAGFFATIGIVNVSSTATKIANQVTNAFGLDSYGDTNATWRNYAGKVDTYAVAPDHLIMTNMTNPVGKNTGIQTEDSSYYGKMEHPIRGGGYYVDTETGLPAEQSVVICQDGNFSGSSYTYYGNQSSATLPWNDAVSSIKVKPGYKATLYYDTNFGGSSWSYYCDCSLVPWNDTASSIKIEKIATPPVACVFKNADYGEIPVCFFGATDIANITSTGQQNDAASSVRIFDPNYNVVLYENTNYGGATLTVTQDAPNLANNSFNDKASSLRVVHK